jgi:N6-adenosine-specific RNA methylase IME4
MYFDVIVVDPAWRFNDGLKKMRDGVKRSAQSKYRTMTIDEIKAMPVRSVADPAGAVIVLWVPGCMLRHGLDVMEAWGFDYKQNYVWVKSKKDAIRDAVKKGHLDECTSFGMGRLFRQCHELALIGTRGRVQAKLANKSQRSVSFARNAGHSVKPEKLQRSLELMFPTGSYLELFARRQRPTWVCLGDQLQPGTDITDLLEVLVTTKNTQAGAPAPAVDTTIDAPDIMVLEATHENGNDV